MKLMRDDVRAEGIKLSHILLELNKMQHHFESGVPTSCNLQSVQHNIMENEINGKSDLEVYTGRCLEGSNCTFDPAAVLK